MLEIVISLVFLFFLLSLLASAIQEIVASYLDLRGKYLEKGINNILSNQNYLGKEGVQPLGEGFFRSVIFKKLYPPHIKGKPDYLSSDSFVSILLQLIIQNQQSDEPLTLNALKASVNEMPTGDVKELLQYYLKGANNLNQFKRSLDNWYDEVMREVTGWYKRNAKKLLFGIGFALAVFFNANTFSIYNQLALNPETASQIADQAAGFVQNNKSILMDSVILNKLEASDTANYQEALIERIDTLQDISNELIKVQIESLRAPLGLGWDNGWKKPTWKWGKESGFATLLYNLMGWLVTALAISLGAPFWFDLLKKLVNLRNSGTPPKEEEEVLIPSPNPKLAKQQGNIQVEEGHQIVKIPKG